MIICDRLMKQKQCVMFDGNASKQFVPVTDDKYLSVHKTDI